MGVSRRSYAAQRGVSEAAVRKAIATGRITTLPNGTICGKYGCRIVGIPTLWRVSPGPCQGRMGQYCVLPEIRGAVPKRQQEMKAPTVCSINGDSRVLPVRTGRPLRARHCAVGSMQSHLTTDLVQIRIGNADQAPPAWAGQTTNSIIEKQNITHGVHTSCAPKHSRPLNHLQYSSTIPEGLQAHLPRLTFYFPERFEQLAVKTLPARTSFKTSFPAHG